MNEEMTWEEQLDYIYEKLLRDETLDDDTRVFLRKLNMRCQLSLIHELEEANRQLKEIEALANRLENNRNQKIPSGTNDPSYQWAKGHNDAQNYISGEIRKIIGKGGIQP